MVRWDDLTSNPTASLRNTIITLAVWLFALIFGYVVLHAEAIRAARESNIPVPRRLDYRAHRHILESTAPKKRGVRYWIPFACAIVLVQVLTAHLPFVMSLGIAAAAGFAFAPLIRRAGQPRD